MANVSLQTVCVLVIVLHKIESLSLNIDRDLCLETIIKFMHDQQKCRFNYSHANGLLKDDDVTCQTKCHVTINDIYSRDYKLGKVELKFGGKINEYKPSCSWMNTLPVLNMDITCPAWNEVKVPIGGYCKQNEQCHGSENSGVCKLGKCVCRAGYVLFNLECYEGNLALNKPCSFNEQCAGSPYASCLGGICSCIEGCTAGQSTYCTQVKVPVGGYCTQNGQCQGNENSGVCKQGRCVCRAGYIQYNLKCHEGNLALNEPCSFSEQCTGSPYASCLGGKCSCIEGYTVEESTRCVQIKVPIGGYCTQNEQCQESEISGVCEHGRCVCKAGYIQYNLKCHEGNFALDQHCSFSEQCAGSPYASCLGGKCSCIEGYTAEESTCVRTKVPIGGYCTQNEQCEGSDILGVCEHGRCVCISGYIQYNLKCLEGNLTLNQSCSFSEQCAGSPYASCLGEICSCIEGYTTAESTYCAQAKVPVGGYCTKNEQCQEREISGVCEHGRCVCRAGYILYNLKCLEETLALNQSCALSDQCAGSPNATCFGGKCTCIEGYSAENSTKCVQSREVTLPSSLQHHQEEAKIETTLGALFGGLFLGVVLTIVAVRIFYRRSKTYVNKREEPNVAFADNNRYSLAKIVNHGPFQNIETKDKKREVSPYACSKETWIYDNVYSKPRNRQTQEAIYNHLHEQVKQDDDDYYDHACAASAQIRDMEDYSHVQQTTS